MLLDTVYFKTTTNQQMQYMGPDFDPVVKTSAEVRGKR